MSEPRWIPVTERLPDNKVRVYVLGYDATGERVMDYGYRDGDNWTGMLTSVYLPVTVTDWMPTVLLSKVE